MSGARKNSVCAKSRVLLVVASFCFTTNCRTTTCMAVRFPWWSASTSSTPSATSSDDALSVQEDLTDEEQEFLQLPSYGAVEGPPTAVVEPTVTEMTTAEYVATVINAKTDGRPAEGGVAGPRVPRAPRGAEVAPTTVVHTTRGAGGSPSPQVVIVRESCREKANCDKNPYSDAESTAVPSDEDRSDADHRSDDADGGSPTTFEQESDDGLEYGTQPGSPWSCDEEQEEADLHEENDEENGNVGSGSPETDAESTHAPSDMDDLVSVQGAESDDAAASTEDEADQEDNAGPGSPDSDAESTHAPSDMDDLVSVQGAESDDAAAPTEDEAADHEDNAGSGSPDSDAQSTHAPSDMGDLVEDMEGAESDDSAASTDVPWDASAIEYEDSESEAECLSSCEESASHDPIRRRFEKN